MEKGKINLKKKIIFFGNFNFKKIGNETQTNVNASTNKLYNLISNLNINNIKIYIVSSPTISGINADNSIFRFNGINIYHKSIKKTLFRKLFSLFFFLNILKKITKIKKHKYKIFFYNSLPEYLFAIIYCKIFNLDIFLDIEDSPRRDEFNINAIVNSIFFYIYKNYFFKNYMCTNIKNYNLIKKYNKKFIYYGSIKKFIPNNLLTNDKILILFSGTINKATGLNIFIELVHQINIDDNYMFIRDKVHFYVTGNLDRSDDVSSLLNYSNVSLKLNLPYNDYLNLLSNVNLAFNLRIPNSYINNTTFPSKIIEYLRHNIHIISSKNEDLESFKFYNSVFIMEKYDSYELIKLIGEYITLYQSGNLKFDHDKIKSIFCADNIIKYI
ncbi:MAG: hypothetical protein CBC25_05790 [Pelagibacteraceae bacterium TMED65]|nr:MAG: hypothetical protein CBC25_05790 [Pelagibacteraceae bacterium TMED65]